MSARWGIPSAGVRRNGCGADNNMNHTKSKKTQSARGWTGAGICTNCVYTIPASSDVGLIPFFGEMSALPSGWLCSTQKWGMSSQIMSR